MDRFLLADNPMTGNNTAIIHTVDPVAIIEVLQGHMQLQTGTHFAHYTFTNVDGLQEAYTFRLHHFFTREFDSEQHGAQVARLFNKAWHWYMAYMNWEDQQPHEGF